ncbi:MAG: LysM peptidoglycan-binding domain-containing protein [Candidatus Cloacimonetes bacterium]|nr:LysM peptidoglycan-binding domain-containing protein [Candidatus Cloacimonadota bacterium]
MKFRLTCLIFIILITAFLSGCSTILNYFPQREIEKETTIIEEPVSQVAQDLSDYAYLKSIYSDDVNELLNLVYYKDKKIDSLYTLIEYLYFKTDSLYQDLDYFNGRVMINTDFEIPKSFVFAGRVFDISNDRIYHKFSEIFDQELKAAHRFIPRSSIYFPLFDEVFTSHGVPLDVKYLAIAESGLSSMATSSVGAGGIWQFMPSTARQYDLRIDNFIDERRNIFKATDAAARYLINSYQFMQNLGSDDWLLAMCAYNAGNNGVARVMREQQANDFFDLIMRVDETNRYVWRAAAIKLIFENEELLFGKRFKREPSLLEVTRIETLNLNGYYQLNDWVQAQGTVLRRIWELNPWINLSQRQRQRYSAINDMVLPPGEYEILVPKESDKNEEQLARIERGFLDRNAGYFTHHTVQRGDTLYDIARRYNTTVANIRSINNLQGNTIYPGQRLQILGSPSAGGSGSGSNIYVVQSGDSLDSIARKLNVSLSHLLTRNNLSVQERNGRRIVIIHPGQRIHY